MNFFDYLFEQTKELEKNLLLRKSEQASYHEIHVTSLFLAQHIQETIGSRNNILIISANSLFFITAYLAIIKSNNICIPLNPEIEEGTLKYILKECNPKLIFTPYAHNQTLIDAKWKIVDEKALKEIVNQKAEIKLLESDFDSNNIAEIIFTSGTTGTPKGVMLTHKNLIANTNSIISYLELSEKDTMLVVLPFNYCYGLSLLHTHIRVGGSLVLNNSFMFLGTVINNLKEYKCTGFAGVPTHFQILLRKTKDFKNTDFPNLKYVTQAGGKLHDAFILEFIETFPKIKFYVMYGQTEATARLSFLPPHLIRKKIGSIGKGIPGVDLNVIDSFDNQVKTGEVGELVARGENIMLGYYNDEKTTKETIRNNWLRTGDLGVIDDEGFIYITGRRKEILKIRGNRISPKEIEGVILQIENVIDCIISETMDDTVGETIKAEIIVNNDSGITSDFIQEYCSKELESFKIPRVIEIKKTFKLNASGKKYN
ncbi:MAG: AMP-binding protein [Bacteroidales bacterium]|nr:AMP-binding protein [Bacteroidales bacterium]